MSIQMLWEEVLPAEQEDNVLPVLQAIEESDPETSTHSSMPSLISSSGFGSSSISTPTTLTTAAIAVDVEIDSLDGSWTEDFQIGMLRDAEDVEDDFFGSTTRARAHFGSTTRARALCHLHTNMPDYEATADPMQLYLANFCLDYPPWKSHTVAWQHLVSNGPWGRGYIQCAGCGFFVNDLPEYGGFCCIMCCVRYFNVTVKGSKATHGEKCSCDETYTFEVEVSDEEDGQDSDCHGLIKKRFQPPRAPPMELVADVISEGLLRRLEEKLGKKLHRTVHDVIMLKLQEENLHLGRAGGEESSVELRQLRGEINSAQVIIGNQLEANEKYKVHRRSSSPSS